MLWRWPKPSREKRQALQRAVDGIRKASPDTPVYFGKKDQLKETTVVPSGVPPFDRAMIVGGLPRAKITEIFGGESTGKTTLALQAARSAQVHGGLAGIVDVEHGFDPGYAEKLGLSVPDLAIVQPDTAEDAFVALKDLISSQALDVLVLDSIIALVTKAEQDGKLGVTDAKTALPTFLSTELRKLCAHLAGSSTAVLATNQVRTQIKGFGRAHDDSPGGKAMKHFATIRGHLTRVADIKSPSGRVWGARIKLKTVKNKLGAPFHEGEADLIFGKGFSLNRIIFDLAKELEVLEQRGSWFSFRGQKLGQGKDAVVTALSEDRDLLAAVEDATAKKFAEQLKVLQTEDPT